MNMPQDTNIYTALPERKGGVCKKPEDVSHFGASIRHAKGELSGFSRIAGDISPEVRRAVIDLIIDEAVRRGHSIRDIAYILLIARLESGFNPDAAACGSSASGVMQITDITAQDIAEVTAQPEWQKKNPHDVGIDLTDAADRFNARKNIIAGIVQYERCKAKTLLVLKSSDRSIYEPRIYQYYHAGLYFDGRKSPNTKKIDKYGLNAFKEHILPFLDAVETALQKTGKFQARLTQPDGKPYSNVEYLAFVPERLAINVADKMFNWVLRLFNKSSTSAKASTENKSTGQAATSDKTPTPPPSSSTPPPNTQSAKAIPYPARIKDGAAFKVVQGKTDGEGKTAEIPVKGVSEVYLCILEYDYDNKAANLQQQREENKDSQSGTGSDDDKAGSAGNAEGTSTDTPTSSGSPSDNATPNSEENDDALKVDLDEQYSPRRWSAMYCDRKPDIEKIAEGFRKAGKPFEIELLEFSRSYIAKPSTAVDAAAPTTAEPSKPVQVEHISTSLKKEQLKESNKPVATVDTKPDNPNAATKGQMPTRWMDIAMKERFQQEVPGTVETDPEAKKILSQVRTLSAENQKLKERLKAERKGTPKANTEQTSSIQAEIEKNKMQINRLIDELGKFEKKNAINNPRIIEYLESTGMREILHTSFKSLNDEIPWCASFVNWCLIQAKCDGLRKDLAARAKEWANYGKEVPEGTYGAIVVIGKSASGANGAHTPSGSHVGFLCMEGKNEKGVNVVRILGGNQTYDIGTEENGKRKNWSRSKVGRVTIGEFPKSEWSVIARRFPVEQKS